MIVLPEQKDNATALRRAERRTLILHLCLIVFVSYCVFFYRLGARPLADPDEARYGETVREMIEHHEWITPTFNNEPRLEKPILIYWLAIVAQKAFGLNEWALRIFPALFAFLSVMLLYAMTRLFFSPRAGLLAALILCASLFYAAIARIVLPDMCLSFFIALSLLSFYAFMLTESRFYLLATYVGLGLGLLTKGPVALVIPGLVILVFLIIQRKLRLLRKSKPLLGIIIICLIMLPWFIPLLLQHKDILRYYLVEETLQRFFTSKFKRTQGPHYFWVLFAGSFFPWTLFLIAAAIRALKRGLKRVNAESPFEMYLWLWLIVPLVFFTISKSQQPVYITPLFPAAAALVALWASETLFSRAPRKAHDASWLIPAIITVFAASLVFAVPRAERTLQLYAPTVYVALVIFLVLSGVALLLWLRGQRHKGFSLILATQLILFTLLLPTMNKYLGQRRSAKAASDVLQGVLKPADSVVAYKSDARASMMFYLKRTIPSFEDTDDLIKAIDASAGRTFVVCKPKYYEKLQDYHLLDRVLFRDSELMAVLAAPPKQP